MRKGRIDTGLFGEPARSYYRERRMMRRKFRASLMSDTKWRKLFLAIERLKLELPVCRIKWTFGDGIDTMPTPTSHTLYPPRPFVESRFGPFALCSVEWLEFPRVALKQGHNHPAGATVIQDVDRAEQALKVIGRFPTENTPESLRVIGHVR